MRWSRWTSPSADYRHRPKEPSSNGAPCAKVLFQNKAKGSLSNGLLIQVTNEKAIYLEKRPVQDANYLRSQAELCLQWRGRDRKAVGNLHAVAA
jgi:hypothetical protein